MTKLADLDPNLDEVVKAAMIDDDGRPEAEKPEESEKEDSTPEVDEAQETDDKEEDKAEKEDEAEVEDEPEKEDEIEEAEVEEQKPEKKPTRKQKREAKRQRYLESIRRQGEQNSTLNRPELFQADPNYKPIDYNQTSEYEVDALQQDREKYGQLERQRGAELANRLAEQKNFWTVVEYEDKLLKTDPKYSFLNQDDKDNWDEDLAEEMHEKFFQHIGYNPDTQFAARTDISFKKFVEREVETMERWAARNESEIIENSVKQRAQTGIRPSGSPSKSLGTLKPGDISKMSAAEYEKNKAEIDRQILAQL